MAFGIGRMMFREHLAPQRLIKIRKVSICHLGTGFYHRQAKAVGQRQSLGIDLSPTDNKDLSGVGTSSQSRFQRMEDLGSGRSIV